MFLAITRKKDENGDPTNEVGKAFVETNQENLTRNLENKAEVEYFHISLTAQNATLKKCSIKSGTRAAAPGREIVEVETSDGVVASAEIKV